MARDPNAIEEQIATASAAGHLPLDEWNPSLCGDIDIRIARNGEWFHKGQKIRRMALVRLFASILRREDDGEYYLVTPVEKLRIRVEDTPLLAHSANVTGEGTEQTIDIVTNMDETLRLGPGHAFYLDSYPGTGEPRPLVTVRQGLEARLVTSAFYEITRYVTERRMENRNLLGVWSEGIFFELGEGG
jgi:hypothetical protein